MKGSGIVRRVAVALCLVGFTVAPGSPVTQASGAADGQRSTLPQITVLAAATLPLPSDPDTTAMQEVFLNTRISYTGAQVLYISVKSFRLTVDSLPSPYSPQSDDESSALLSNDLYGSALPLTGTLLFIVPAGARRLTLSYKLSSYTVISAAAVAPVVSPTRVYAAAVQPLLRTYLGDEAAVAGTVWLSLSPLVAGGVSGALPIEVATTLRVAQGTLAGDRAAFERSAAIGSGAQQWRHRALAIFAALDRDLRSALTLRGDTAAWTAWLARFSADDHQLGALYQQWPGLR